MADERRPILRSKRVFLRPAERKDIPTFLVWLADAEVSEGLATRAPWSRIAEETWFDELQKSQGKTLWHFVICLRDGQVITTRTYQDRLETLGHVQAAGMKVCSGGILGMGESRRDRASMLHQLANLPKHPESVPVNLLVQVEGTPLYGTPDLDPLDLVRTIAAARVLMPRSYVRLSAGRSDMSDELQALCFLAGANSVFYGERLLTTPNAESDRDQRLFERLGMTFETVDSGARNAPGPCSRQAV